MSLPQRISLAEHEVTFAAIAGIRRRVTGLFDQVKGIAEAAGRPMDWTEDIEAACAEMAFAKYAGLYWDGSVNTFGRPDVGTKFQVRHTLRADGGLIVRVRDEGKHTYWLVTGKAPRFTVQGYMPGTEAKCNDFRWEDAWLVPQTALHGRAA